MTEFTQPFPWPVLAAGCALAALIVVASHLWPKGSKAGRGGAIRTVLVLLRIMAMAILAEFKGSRWMAILLSGDGEPYADEEEAAAPRGRVNPPQPGAG